MNENCFKNVEELPLTLTANDLAPINIMLPLIASVYLSPLNEFLKQGGYEPKPIWSHRFNEINIS